MRHIMLSFAALAATGVAWVGRQEPGYNPLAWPAPPLGLEGMWLLQREDQGTRRASKLTIHRHDGLVRINELNRDFTEENPNRPGWTLRDVEGEWVFVVQPVSAKSFTLTESSSGKRWTVRTFNE